MKKLKRLKKIDLKYEKQFENLFGVKVLISLYDILNLESSPEKYFKPITGVKTRVVARYAVDVAYRYSGTVPIKSWFNQCIITEKKFYYTNTLKNVSKEYALTNLEQITIKMGTFSFIVLFEDSGESMYYVKS